MILVLGGTSESREVTELLIESGYEVLYTSTTGIIAGLSEPVVHLIGELDETSFKDLLEQYPVRCIIDATHPFAMVIKTLAEQMAVAAGIPCIRLERNHDTSVDDDPSVATVESLRSAVEKIAPVSGGILSTIGSRLLPQLCEELGERRRDLIVRVLPVSASIAECEKYGIHPSRIIAMQGPFDRAFNLWCKTVQCHYHATKGSGDRGGLRREG
jgi:precorrin-6x reductase